jgi:anti-sigma28 factor (negative regulator of flagellin synthesis)
MNMPPMNPDAARMNSMGADQYQMSQAMQQEQARGAQNAMTQSTQAIAQVDRVSDEMQSAQAAQESRASDFLNARIAALKNATTGNQGEQALREMDPQVLQALVNSL